MLYSNPIILSIGENQEVRKKISKTSQNMGLRVYTVLGQAVSHSVFISNSQFPKLELSDFK